MILKAAVTRRTSTFSVQQQQGARKQRTTHQSHHHDIRGQFADKRPQQQQQRTEASSQRHDQALGSYFQVGNTHGLDSRSSRNPPHISIQRSAARSKEATHNNTPIEPTRHALPVRRQMATAAAAAQRDTITATSASPELIGNTDGQGMNMLLHLPTQQHLTPPDDQSLKSNR